MQPGRVFDSLAQSIKARPAILSLYGRLKERPNFNARVVRRDDHILIDGYPRSANTFATVAFLLSQHSPTHVANHMHTPGQFFLARKWAIPALLLIRRPEDAIVSYAVYLQSVRPIPIPLLVRRYIFLYQSVLPLHEHYVIGTFDEVTSNFGAVVQRINDRFETSFSLFEHTTASQRRVEQFVTEQRARRMSMASKLTARTALPHDGRMRLRTPFEDEIMHRSNHELLQKARDIYHRVLERRRV